MLIRKPLLLILLSTFFSSPLWSTTTTFFGVTNDWIELREQGLSENYGLVHQNHQNIDFTPHTYVPSGEQTATVAHGALITTLAIPFHQLQFLQTSQEIHNTETLPANYLAASVLLLFHNLSQFNQAAVSVSCRNESIQGQPTAFIFESNISGNKYTVRTQRTSRLTDYWGEPDRYETTFTMSRRGNEARPTIRKKYRIVVGEHQSQSCRPPETSVISHNHDHNPDPGSGAGCLSWIKKWWKGTSTDSTSDERKPLTQRDSSGSHRSYGHLPLYQAFTMANIVHSVHQQQYSHQWVQ